jgi:shikimate kinase
VFLCGAPGSGKSTIGRALARRLGRPFADVDQLVIERAGKPIAAIFADDGEPAFRALEARALAEAAEGPSAVIALGGGTLLAPENRAAIARSGTLVYLRAAVETLETRLAHQRIVRPLLARASVGELLAARRPLYEAADLACDVDGKPVMQVVDEIEAAL